MGTVPSHLVAFLIASWIALAGLAVGLGMAMRRIRRAERRYERLTEGASAERLEEVLLEHIGQIRSNQREIERLAATVDAHGASQDRTLQRLGLVRFNPFDDTGGQYSFALAMTDREGNGVVLCSLHGRGSTRMYAKPLVDWTSTTPLSDEEQQAVSLLRADEPRAEE